MFLLERLVGISLFAAVLLFMCFLISTCKSHRGVRVVLFCYTIVLSVMAFFYVPYVTADLYRIYGSLNYFRTFDFVSFLERYQNSSAPISDIYYWLISKTGENRLLPAVSSFITFSCIFYVFRKTMEKYKISEKNVAITLFFVMSTGIFITVTGVRNIIAVSLVVFCFFRETVEKKFRLYHILLYIIAALMHNFAVAIILIRLIIPLFDRTMKAWKRIVYILFLAILSILLFANINELLESVFEKAMGYITGKMYSYTWGYIIGALILAIVIINLIQYSKIRKGDVKDLNQLRLFSIISISIAMLCFFEYSIFSRTSSILLPVIYAPCFMLVLEKSKDSRFRNNVIIISVVIMVVSFLRGEMSGYKFFVL